MVRLIEQLYDDDWMNVDRDYMTLNNALYSGSLTHGKSHGGIAETASILGFFQHFVRTIDVIIGSAIRALIDLLIRLEHVLAPRTELICAFSS